MKSPSLFVMGGSEGGGYSEMPFPTSALHLERRQRRVLLPVTFVLRNTRSEEAVRSACRQTGRRHRPSPFRRSAPRAPFPSARAEQPAKEEPTPRVTRPGP